MHVQVISNSAHVTQHFNFNKSECIIIIDCAQRLIKLIPDYWCPWWRLQWCMDTSSLRATPSVDLLGTASCRNATAVCGELRPGRWLGEWLPISLVACPRNAYMAVDGGRLPGHPSFPLVALCIVPAQNRILQRFHSSVCLSCTCCHSRPNSSTWINVKKNSFSEPCSLYPFMSRSSAQLILKFLFLLKLLWLVQ